MIRHCVLLRFVVDATDEQRRAVLDGLAGLPGAIPEIERYEFGDDLGLDDANWDLAVTGDFADADAYRVYAQHPDHVALIADHIRPILADRAAVQLTLAD